MSDAAAIRAWAAENGYELGSKGRIPATVREAYGAATGQPVAEAPDYPDGMTEDDFTDPDGPPAEPGGQGDEPESRPRTGGAKRSRPGLGSLRRGKPKAKRPGHAKPRVPVEETISNGWRIMSRIARPIPPLERTLKMESIVAGRLLEPTVKGTVVDAVLQPIARYQAKGKVGAALLGPPVIITAISLHVQRQAMLGQPPNPLFMSAATEMLREALMLWLEVAGPEFDAALEKERQFEQRHGQTVDELMAWLMSDPVNPEDPESVRREQAAYRRAWGQPEPEPEPGQYRSGVLVATS